MAATKGDMLSLFGRRKRTVSNSDKTGVQNPAFNADGGIRGSRISVASDISMVRGGGNTGHSITLHHCARDGDLEGIRAMVNKSKKVLKYVNRPDNQGQAPLHYAARFSHFDCVKYLVENCGADIVVRDNQDATPLHYAAKKRETGYSEASINVIKYLAKKMEDAHNTDNRSLKSTDDTPINVNVKDKYMSTPLHFAAMRGNELVTKTLLDTPNIDISARDDTETTPLHEAVTYDHTVIVKLLLKHKANVLVSDEEKITPLHLAAMQGNLEIVKMLIHRVPEARRQEYAEAKDNTGNLAIHLAIENKNAKIVEYFLDEDLVSTEAINKYCREGSSKLTALHLGSVIGDVNILTMLLRKQAEINVRDGSNMTPLHRAVEYDHLEAVILLLDSGALIEATDDEMFTPLLLACCSKNTAVLAELLNRGANIDAQDSLENTAIRLATKYDNVPGMKLLLRFLKKSKDQNFVNVPERQGNTPLHLSCRLGRAKITELLLKYGAEWHCKNEEEESPFHLAAMCGHTDVCQILMDASENKVIHDEDEDSNTSLHLAAEKGHLNVVQLLVENGADKVARNLFQWTPLDFAASEGHTNIVKFLLEEDVPTNPTDKEGTTPLHLACKNGHVDTVKHLLEKGADVASRDAEGNTALDITIHNHHIDVALAIIESPLWRLALTSDTARGKNKIRDTPMRKLVRKMPSVAEKVLDKCMSVGPEDHSPDDDDLFISFNFEFIDDTFSEWKSDIGMENVYSQEEVYTSKGFIKPTREPYSNQTSLLKDNHILMMTVHHNRGDLLFHPVMLALMRNKWNKASIFYYIFIIFYSLFLALLTGYMLSAEMPYGINITECEIQEISYQSNFEAVATFWLYVLCGMGMLLEGFQFWAVKTKYLEPNNLLDWFTYISTIIVVTSFSSCGLKTDWQWQLAAFTVFIAWLDMLLFLRRLPRVGIYVVMIVDIFKTFMKFFMIFFLFIVAFACSFNILLRNQDPFRTGYFSIIKTWVMMIGEFDFNDIFHPSDQDAPDALKYVGMTYTIFVLFLVLMAIIIMNLLTGLAVDDVNELQANAMVKKATMQIELALDVEVALPYWLQRKATFVHRYQKIYPNRDGNMILKYLRMLLEGNFMSKESIVEKVLDNSLQGKPEDTEKKEFQESVLKKMKKTKNEIVGLKEQMTRMEEMLGQLLEKKEKKALRRSSQLPPSGADV